MQAWGRAREVEKIKPKPGDELKVPTKGIPGAFDLMYVPADAKQYAVCMVRGHDWQTPPYAPGIQRRCGWCGLRIQITERVINPPKVVK